MMHASWAAELLQRMLDVSHVFNTSVAASWMVLAVLLLRFLLKKAPKRFAVILWGIVAVRLLMPVSVESSFSLLPGDGLISDQLLRAEGLLHQEPAYLELVTNPFYPEPITVELQQSIGSFQWEVLFWTWPWLIGMAVMMLYALVSWVRLHYRVQTAVRLRDNLLQSEQVRTPFVFGLFRPNIYLPFRMEQRYLEYVVAHEQAHIRRKDHWWKLLGYVLLAVHWFNPLMWLAYVLLCRDLELACDEAVVYVMEPEQRADYAQALLSCSTGRHVVSACPLAFGEIGIKARIRSVARYRKPGFWIVTSSVLVCLLLALCFLTDPVGISAEVLHYQTAIPLVESQEMLTAIYCPSGESSIQIGVTEGAALAKQLEQWRWRPCKAPYERLPSPGSVEFVIEENYRITVHHRKEGQLRQYAVVRYGEEVQYYTIDRSDYPDAVALLLAPPMDTSVKQQQQGQYYLTIGAEGIAEIRVEAPGIGGGVMNADGTPFDRGSRVWMEQLDGRSDLRGVAVTALNAQGEIVWSLSVPDGTENTGVQNAIEKDWKLEYTE